MSDLRTNPYRLFFPIALFGILTGLSLMLVPLNAYALIWHREWMIGLFLLPIVIGFLFTAGPRFYASFPVTWFELILAFLSLLGMIATAAAGNELGFVISRFVAILVLLAFLLVRIAKRTSGFPIFSPFILGSLALGIFGSVAHLLLALQAQTGLQIDFIAPDRLVQLRSSCYYVGMFQVLIYGVGTRFFPMMTIVARPGGTAYGKLIGSSKTLWFGVALVFVLTFVAEGLGFVSGALWTRAVVVTFIGVEGWLVFRKFEASGVYPVFVRLVLITAIVAQVLYPFFPGQRVHLYHATFVGIFGMGVLMVVGHVVIAHERLDLSMRNTSRIFAIAFGLLYLGLLTRATAQITKSYTFHLQMAAACALLGVLLFSGKLLLELIRKSRSGSPGPTQSTPQ
ncbi:MAG: NnrS family protein [Leptospirales bacterium]|nr:NnrS family protein [Leptospirales bacterium]